MDLDEILYHKVLKFIKKTRKTDPELEKRTILLHDVKVRLTILARAITGEAIEIFGAEREGGYRNNNFFLPPKFSIFETPEENLQYYFFRLLYLSCQQKLDLNWPSEMVMKSELSSEMAHETSAKVLELLFEEYPSAEKLHQKFYDYLSVSEKPDYSWLYGKWMKNDPEIEKEKTLNNFTDKVKEAIAKQEMTIKKAKPVESVTSIEVDKKQQEDYVLTHNFEKVETADEFSGVWRDFDGDDELEKHQDALDELNMKFTVRVDDAAHSVYQADFIENTTVSESGESDEKGFHIKYDEWDYSKRRYKEDFCKVYTYSQQKTDVNYYKTTISQKNSLLIGLRKMLTNLNNKMQQKRRQYQGEEFDIDAATDMIVDVLSKKSPSENIYLSKHKIEKDISILLLLDVSLSSDGYADGNRVIDVEKQVSILFGEILEEFKIDFSINCFYSKTRNYSSYLTLKEFDEDWNKAKHKIGAVEPQGFTRIGAALRHSGALLDKRTTKNKWVILISDGKPNDYDKYEGKYGVNDVKQAIRELSERKINAYALTVEAQAKFYLPQMFGQNHYQILTSPEELLKSLVKLYEKIKYQS